MRAQACAMRGTGVRVGDFPRDCAECPDVVMQPVRRVLTRLGEARVRPGVIGAGDAYKAVESFFEVCRNSWPRPQINWNQGGIVKGRIFLTLSLLLVASNSWAVERDASQPYRPPGEAQQWNISGRMHGPLKIALRINGQLVFDAPMDAQPTGIYRDKPVRANCTTRSGFIGRADMSCEIYVGDELAANLVFIKG
jgi:hypothetical protein